MTRDIIIKNDDFVQYYGPLVADDIQAYRIVYKPNMDINGKTLRITAKRADGATVMDTAPIQGDTAYYILKNNMHSIVGDVRIRLALVDDIGTVLTNKEIVCQVIEGSGEIDLTGDDRVPLLSSMIAQTTNASNYAKEQGDYAKEQGDYAKEQGDYAKDKIDQMQGHIEDSSIHVTLEEKSNWNGKAENSDFLNHKQDLIAHAYEGEKDYWNSALHQEELPPPNEDKYTYGELGNLSDNFYVVPYDGISALNIPSNSTGVLKKLGTAGDIFFRFIDKEGSIYHGDYTQKAKYPFLQVEEDWWQKIDPKDYQEGGTIAEKFTQIEGQIEDVLHQKELLPPSEDKYTYGELADLSDDFYTVSIENKQALNLPAECEQGILKKTVLPEYNCLLQYTDISGRVYYYQYNIYEMSSYPFLPIEAEKWQKTDLEGFNQNIILKSGEDNAALLQSTLLSIPEDEPRTIIFDCTGGNFVINLDNAQTTQVDGMDTVFAAQKPVTFMQAGSNKIVINDSNPSLRTTHRALFNLKNAVFDKSLNLSIKLAGSYTIFKDERCKFEGFNLEVASDESEPFAWWDDELEDFTHLSDLIVFDGTDSDYENVKLTCSNIGHKGKFIMYKGIDCRYKNCMGDASDQSADVTVNRYCYTEEPTDTSIGAQGDGCIYENCNILNNVVTSSGTEHQIGYKTSNSLFISCTAKLSYNTDYGNDYSLYFAGFIGSNNKLISCYIEMSNLYAFTGYGMPADFNNQYINCQLLAYKKGYGDFVFDVYGSSARDSCYEGCKFVFKLNMYSSYYKILYTSGSTIKNCQLYAYDELGNDVERADVFYSGGNNLLVNNIVNETVTLEPTDKEYNTINLKEG